jgi:HK97 gp10 family phage protein
MVRVACELDLKGFKIKEMARSTEQKQDKAVKACALLLENPLKRECPAITHNLERSIGTKQFGKADWGNTTNVEYAKYVIWGTSRQEANNFPERAVRQSKDKIKQMLINSFKK